MDAFEKWWHGPQPILGDGKFHDGKEVAQEAFLAGKAEGIKEGMRRAAEICRARAVKLAPEHTAHTGDGCYDCGAEDEADYLALAILKEAGE